MLSDFILTLSLDHHTQYVDHLIALNQSFAEVQHDSKFPERENRQRLDQVVCYHFADE
jgi:hypothetical protein